MKTIKLEAGIKLLINEAQPENRAKASAKLKRSIKDTNGNELMPAIVHNGVILDGHRRYEACILEKVPFYYIEATGNVPNSFIQMLNSTSVSWTTKNYIASYASMSANYRKLWNYIEETKIPIGLLSSLANLSEVQLIAGVDFKINYKQLGFRIKVYNQIRSLYPSASANLCHRSLGKMYKHKDFDDKDFWKKITNIDECEAPTHDRMWLIRELSAIADKPYIYEDLKSDSYEALRS